MAMNGHPSDYGFSALVWVLQAYGEPANTLHKRRHIRLATLLFKQYQFAFPVTKFSAVGDVRGSE
jgi:hypothetical protein